MRGSSNGRTPARLAGNVGSIPAPRSGPVLRNGVQVGPGSSRRTAGSRSRVGEVAQWAERPFIRSAGCGFESRPLRWPAMRTSPPLRRRVPPTVRARRVAGTRDVEPAWNPADHGVMRVPWLGSVPDVRRGRSNRFDSGHPLDYRCLVCEQWGDDHCRHCDGCP